MYDHTISSSFLLPNLAARLHRAETSATDLLILGEVHRRTGTRLRFGLKTPDRFRHLWVVGKTGGGKSTLLARLVSADAAADNGLVLLDPHGTLVEAVLPQIPVHRAKDVLLIRPGDTSHPIAFNPFGMNHPLPLLVAHLVSLFHKHWAEWWGPRLEHVLRHGILAVAEHPEASFELLYRFLVDDDARDAVLLHVTASKVRFFWEVEWQAYPKTLRAEALSPILNKLGALVHNPFLAPILSPPANRVDLTTLMNTRAIILADLSVGKIGEDASHLLGSVLLSSLELTTMSRPRSDPPMFVYIDEFQRFVTGSLTTTLAESRKFGLAFTLAHQYLAQLPPALSHALIGNVGNIVAFQVGAEDAETLSPIFAPAFTAYDLMRLKPYHLAVRQLSNGESVEPFGAICLPPLPLPTDVPARVAEIEAASRARYSYEASPPPTPSKAACPPPFSWA